MGSCVVLMIWSDCHPCSEHETVASNLNSVGVWPGVDEPLNAQGATNFALYSEGATAVSLCLFTEKDLQGGKTTCEIVLNPTANKSGHIWHVSLPKLDSTLLYGKY